MSIAQTERVYSCEALGASLKNISELGDNDVFGATRNYTEQLGVSLVSTR